MSFTYSAVDQSADPGEAVVWQERMNAQRDIRAYKEHTYDLVAEARLVLDVGCGPGTDAVELGADRVVGLDPSSVMCGRAAGRGITVCRGDAHALPFGDEVFDACRADRVLQHLTDPAAAVGELVRVTRRGGRVVVADPDQESLTLHVPGVSREIIDRVKRLRRDVGYRNGRLASELPQRFASGLTDVEVRAFPLVITDPDDAFGLPTWPRWWHSRGIGGWSDDDLDQWDRALGADRDGDHDHGFVFAVLYFVVTGTRP